MGTPGQEDAWRPAPGREQLRAAWDQLLVAQRGILAPRRSGNLVRDFSFKKP